VAITLTGQEFSEASQVVPALHIIRDRKCLSNSPCCQIGMLV